MALVIANRVQETTTTTGTGTVTLAGSASGFQSFAVVGNTNTTYYTITSGTDWEVGIGTYSTTGPTLARTTILSSSNANAAITLAGTSIVFSSYPAEKVISDGYGLLPVANGGTGQSSYTNGQLLVGNTTGNTLTKTTLTAGTNVTITNGSGAITINAADQFVGTVTSVGGTGTVNGITLTGTVTTSGSLTLGGTLSGVSLTTQVTGTLPVANGGTGATTLTANGVLYGSGTSAIAATAVGTTGQVLVGNTGSAPTWSTLSGIGVTSFSAGTTGLTPSSATTGVVTLAGTLGVANGGTGATTLTSGYLLKGNGTSAVSASVVYDTGTNVSIGTTVARGNLSIGTTAGTATTLAIHLGYTPADFYGFRVTNVSNAASVYAGAFSIQRGIGSAWSDALSISNAGNTTANVDMRAPVFYDSDNTTYYLDPASTSQLVTVETRAGSGFRSFIAGSASIASSIYFADAGNTRAWNWQLDESNNAALWNYDGSSWTKRFTFTSGSNIGIGNSSPPAALSILRNSSTASVAATSSIVLTNKNTAINGTIMGGIFADTYRDIADPHYSGGIWFTRNQTSSNLASGSDIVFGAMENNSSSALPTERLRISATGPVTATVDMRAPIFYDSDNTAYYGDFAGTSNLNALTLASGSVLGAAITFNNMNNPHSTYTDANLVTDFGFRYLQGATNGPAISGATQYYGMTLGLGNNYAYADYASQFYWPRSSTGGLAYPSIRFREGGTWGSWTKIYAGAADAPSGATFAATGDFRAPIFYDSNNTAYYVDPASGTVLGGIVSILGSRNITLSSSGGNVQIKGDAGGWSNGLLFYGSSNTFRGGFGALGSGDVLSYLWAGNDYNNAALYLYAANYAESPGSFRAPIFYDSNDTTYYINPNSSSAVKGAIVIGPNNSYTQFIRLGGEGQASDMATVCTTNGNLHADSKTGFHIYLNYAGNGNIYLNHGGGFTEGITSIRAPIFYDSGNTGYYFDGTATSRWSTSNQDGYHTFNNYGLGVVGLYASTRFQCVWAMGDAYKGNADGTSLSGAYGLWWSYPSAGGPAATLSSHGLMCIVNGSNVAQLDASTRASVDMRAPIFYDTTNTAYYWNFADGSVSNIYTFITGLAYFQCAFGSGVYSSAVTSPPLQVFSNDGGTAMMSFHRGGSYAVNFGLDPDNVLRIGGWSASSNRLQMDMSGNLTMAGNVTAYSDARLKKDVTTIEGALDLVGKMRGVTYTRIDTDKAGVGVIAQEMLEVMPEVVQQGTGEDDTLSVAYGNLVGVLIEAIKELTARVAELEGK